MDATQDLWAAAAAGELEIVRVLFARNTIYTNENNETLLHVASKNGHDKVVKFLIEHVDKAHKDRFGQLALSRAAIGLFCNTVNILLESGAEADVPDDRGRTPLILAIDQSAQGERLSRMVRVVRSLLDRNIDVNRQDQYKHTALHKAAKKGHHIVVQLLVNHELNPNLALEDSEGRTALSWAAFGGLESITRTILNSAAGMEQLKALVAQQDKTGMTPLSLVVRGAVNSGRLWQYCPTIRLLLNTGADVNHEDKDGDTVLKYLDNLPEHQQENSRLVRVELLASSVVRRRIIICCDGTWNDREELQPFTNVSRLFECISAVSFGPGQRVEHLPFYVDGIGTGTTPLGQTLSGATGGGIERKIREAYRHICVTHINASDEIILVGFSRGAYTILCLAHFINDVGLLDHAVVNKELQTLFTQWSHGDPAWENTCNRITSQGMRRTGIRIKAFAAWDVVKSLRPGSKGASFPRVSDELPSNVDWAFHALALDEHRSDFRPQTLSIEDAAKLNQCWFLGSHGDIGGGWENPGFANISFCWMLSQLEDHGCLEIERAVLWDVTDEGSVVRFNPAGRNGQNAALGTNDSFSLRWWPRGYVDRILGKHDLPETRKVTHGPVSRFIARIRHREVGNAHEPLKVSRYEKVHYSVALLPDLVEARGFRAVTALREFQHQEDQAGYWHSRDVVLQDTSPSELEATMLARGIDRDAATSLDGENWDKVKQFAIRDASMPPPNLVLNHA